MSVPLPKELDMSLSFATRCLVRQIAFATLVNLVALGALALVNLS